MVDGAGWDEKSGLTDYLSVLWFIAHREGNGGMRMWRGMFSQGNGGGVET